MNIDLKNIDFSLSKPQVVNALAKVLHEAPFRRSPEHPRMSFHVHLYKATNVVHKNKGSGILELPSVEVGQMFLQMYGSDTSESSLTIGRRRLKFSASKKPPRHDVMDRIRFQPFADPSEPSLEEEWRREYDSSDLKVKHLQFGWICRDHTFSVECEENCSDRCHITFNNSRREIRIHLRLLEEFYLIVISFASINTVSTSANLGRDHALVFYLNATPSYEKEQVGGKQRLKVSHIPIPDHERLAPFTSMAIRVVCGSQRDIRQFRRLCDNVHLNKVDEYDYPVDHRQLFSLRDMITMQDGLLHLPWKVAFQMEALLRNMAIDFKEANALYPVVLQAIQDNGEELVATALRRFRDKADLLFYSDDEDAVDIIEFFSKIVDEFDQQDLAPPRPTDGSLYESFHVDVTPTSFHLAGPFVEQSNRIIRDYDGHQDCFLRVSFVDEALLQYRFNHEVDGREFIRTRIGPLLYNGLKVAGRAFDFLAYSHSALREHAVWFVQPFKLHPTDENWVTASSIISSLGTFHNLTFDPNLIFCPARYAARISQAFTATDAVKVDVDEVIQIDDIYTSDRKYQFTDGVGICSRELSRNIWAQLKKTKKRRMPKEVPPAYQIRFMGSKGMISVDHTLDGLTIGLRPSMVKFLTPETVQDIEIARAFDKPGPYFLNRPLIMLLEGLGVHYQVFKRYQDEAVEATQKAASSLKDAASLLECHGLGVSYRLPSILNHLDKLSLNSLPDDEFYKKMLKYATHHVLRDLKSHSRIPVPGAWTLVGVADTHRYLQEDQIFVCIKPISGGRRYLSGRVLISRSPTIHPGDVRIAEAIGAPPPGSCFEEEPLANTVVFSVQGERPLPSCLGGGDLDGDLYNLIPLDDPDLPELRAFLPERPICSPASYDPAPKKMLTRPSTMLDVADFVMEYISSDVVGIVAMNWLIIADLSREGIFDPDCITLANLHSNAVDYPKSGQPVPLEKIPKVKTRRRPDWNAPETVDLDSSGRFYESRRAIGRLFRAIDLPMQQEPVLPRRRRQGRLRVEARDDGPDDDIETLEARVDNLDLEDARTSHLFETIQDRVEEVIQIDPERDEELADSIARLFNSYAVHLETVCLSNTLVQTETTQLSEAEVVMGTIAQQTTQPRKRKELMSKVRESTDRLVRGIRDELEGDDSIGDEESLFRAWTAWDFSVSQGDAFGAKSFGWIALGVIFDVIKEVEDAKNKKKNTV